MIIFKPFLPLSILVFSLTMLKAQTNIAVIDFSGKNVSATDAAILTERLGAELFSTNKYIILERNKIDEILKEQQFQMSGCTTNECFIEIGQLLNVEQLVVGSISKVGSTYSIFARIISIETGEILTVATYDYNGKIDDLLIKGMRIVANKLANLNNQINKVPQQKINYKTVKIGNQLWMAENLRATHYQNGDPIPNISNLAQWDTLMSGAMCNYNNISNNSIIYGYLYNWYAVIDNRNIAPEGWHIPSRGEWKELEMFLGMSQIESDNGIYRGTNEGGKLKESGTVHWNRPNISATNTSGFSALPGGFRNYSGFFDGIGRYAYFWTSSEVGSGNVKAQYLINSGSGIGSVSINKRNGYSVRCIKD